MLIIDAILVGLGIGVLGGGTLAQLSSVRLKFEPSVLILLAVQLALPALVSHLRISGSIAVASWVIIMLLLTAVVMLNWRQAGMVMIALGIVLNALVISLNSGMPVSQAAIQAATGQPSSADQFANDIVHEPLRNSSVMPVLADVIPVPGPSWHRGVVSVGDIVLCLGVACFLAKGMHGSARPT